MAKQYLIKTICVVDGKNYVHTSFEKSEASIMGNGIYQDMKSIMHRYGCGHAQRVLDISILSEDDAKSECFTNNERAKCNGNFGYITWFGSNGNYIHEFHGMDGIQRLHQTEDGEFRTVNDDVYNVEEA